MLRPAIIALFLPLFAFYSEAQQENCTLKPPSFTIHFGAGEVSESNSMVPSRYSRISGYCPSDGYYTYTSYTSQCFRGDWFTITEDHTDGDVNGNMLLINSSPRSGMFFSTPVTGLKAGKRYEFSVWMMNVCRITEKCPFPLLPDITIVLHTPSGKRVAQLETGEVARVTAPRWTEYSFVFTLPASSESLVLSMINNSPGGCGNDFVMDDVMFRECVIQPPPTATKKPAPAVRKAAPVNEQPKSTTTAKKAAAPTVKTTPPANAKPQTATAKKPVTPPVKTPAASVKQKPKTTSTAKAPVKKSSAPEKKAPATIGQRLPDSGARIDSFKDSPPAVRARVFPAAPAILKRRTNALVKELVIEPGEIRIDLYDNGEIDNDTVSVYHNNRLLASRARLSQSPITFRIAVNDSNPYHELIMVAENLGSIPPNTSLMVVTAGDIRHEVFISSTKQKNAKVILQLGNRK